MRYVRLFITHGGEIMLLKLREKFCRYIGITVGSDVEPEIKALAVMFEKLAVVL